MNLLPLLCLPFFAAYPAAAWRAQGRRLLGLAPAMLAGAWLVALETFLVGHPDAMRRYLKLLLFSQWLLGPSWLIFSLAYARDSLRESFSQSFSPPFRRTGALMLALALVPGPILAFSPASSFFFVTDFSVERVIFLEPAAFYFYLHLVLTLIVSIGNLESTLRASPRGDYWRVKFAVLGAGAAIASFALFYSQGLVNGILNMDYLALRSLGVTAGLVLLLVSEWRRQSGTVRIPRRVAFHSLAAGIAGLYLLGLGLAREGSRIFGAGFERNALFALLFLAGVGGIALLLAHSVRRRAGIWLHRTFYQEKYDYRTQWMQFSERLARAGDKESLIRAVLLSFCETFGFTGAVFFPVERGTSDGVSGGASGHSGRLGLPVYHEMPETAPGLAIAKDCEPLLAYGDPPQKAAESSSPGTRPGATSGPVRPVRVADVTDAGKPRREGRPAARLPESAARHLLAMRASLFFVMPAADGPEGLLVLGRPIDGKEAYSEEDFELMEAMARQAGLCVRGFRLGDELSAAREVEALGHLGAFVLHDLKNQVYSLSLLTENARNFIANTDFQRDMLETLGSAVANMNILIAQLTGLPKASTLRLEPVDLVEAAQKAAAQVPGARVRVGGTPLTVRADAEQLRKVLVNLCLNAVEAGGDKPIDIEVAATGPTGPPELRVRDQAGGIAENIMEQGLFKPFISGKTRGMGIGLYHSRKIMEAHGGDILVENRPGEGSTFIVRFGPPLAARKGEAV